ncbi:response regulator [bacterium]|nr:response regulator [bacterium]
MNKIKLILLEDDPADARLIKEMLASAKGVSFEIEHFDKLKNVLERLSAEGCDLVLTDLHLPDSQGLETYLAIRKQAPALPIVVLTGSYSEDLGIEAIHEGAQDYLLKDDLSSSFLCRSIVYAIERKKIEEDLRIEKDELKDAVDRLKTINKELKETQNKLIESERLATISRVAAAAAAAAAHETRNPLAVIESITYYLNLILHESAPEVRNKLSQIDDAVDRATLYITHLLDFAKPIIPDLKDLEVNGLIEECLKKIPEGMLAGIEIETDFALMLPKIKADPELMRRVFFHLAQNAVEAMEKVKSKKLKVKSEQEGDFIKIRISDTGKGIPEENLLHIFDPFFTTKAKETGLGLAICQRIIAAHQGEIEVKSEVGMGTEFVIKLKRQ